MIVMIREGIVFIEINANRKIQINYSLATVPFPSSAQNIFSPETSLIILSDSHCKPDL
jgi:hypothetical protein